MLIAEMTLYYKEKGLSLYEALIDLYKKHGFYKEELVSIELEGKEGQEKIASCIDSLRNNKLAGVNGVKVVTRYDYKLSIEDDCVNAQEKKINLPKSNVLKYILEDGSSFVVRPSGTEPKMKIYTNCFLSFGKTLTESTLIYEIPGEVLADVNASAGLIVMHSTEISAQWGALQSYKVF